MFHSTGILVATNLAVIAAGLSLMQVGGFDIILESTPRKSSGISLGMTVLFNLIGASVGLLLQDLHASKSSIRERSYWFISLA
jgi:hypothetical protein